MASRSRPSHGIGLHPVHAVLLASILPLLLGALLSDLAYGASYQIQWTNFASWLIAGALVPAGMSAVWAAIDMFRPGGRDWRSSLIYLLLILGTFIFGFVNALVHAKDAWATMPAGLILSVITTILAVAAVWAGFSASRRGDVE